MFRLVASADSAYYAGDLGLDLLMQVRRVNRNTTRFRPHGTPMTTPTPNILNASVGEKR
jgi:hypothetical protein